MKRTFIAIPVESSPELRELIAQLRVEFRGDAISWVDPGILHLTLKFLGDTPDPLIEAVSNALAPVCSVFAADSGSMQGLGYFSFKGTPSVLFARVDGWKLPAMLATALEKELAELGIPPESRPFKTHLTLARIRSIRNIVRFEECVHRYATDKIQEAAADRVVYYESILRPQGPVYKPMVVIPLPGVKQSASELGKA